MSEKEQLQKEVVSQEEKQTEVKTPVVSNAQKKEDKTSNKNKDNKKGKKKEKVKRRRIRETVSELKKVSWPKFGEVAKKTGIVLGVVAIFAVVLLGIEYCLGLLFNLLK